MKKSMKIGLASLAVLGLGFFATNQMFAEQSDTSLLKLTVLEGDLTIGIDDDELLISGSVVSSFSDQTATASFDAKSFWLEDLRGSASGYYTTIQVTNLTNSKDASKVIPAANVKFMAQDASPETISGVNNDQVIAGLTSYTDVSSPKTYIYREKNTGAGLLGKYGDTPSIQVTIPANTPSGDYTGTLTYTLYDEYDSSKA